MISRRENTLRAARFQRPAWIPMHYAINRACWHHYPQDALQDLMEAHPLLFPDFCRSEEPIVPEYAPWERADRPFTDSWGCVWVTTDDGITGSVVGHPLADWSALEGYRPPDPAVDYGWGPIDWDAERERMAAARAAGRLASAGLRHGHTFLTLVYLRGYDRLIYDMADGDPRLSRLIEMVEAFNLALVRRYIAAGAEWMSYPEDLGMQRGPMLSPAHFRRYIKPTYARLMAPAREAGCVVHMHSDGDIRTLVDDLVDDGVQVVNLQDLVNGLDWIEERLAGRVCIDLDVDRQRVTRYGTPADIDALIRDEVTRLGRREGGLMMVYGLYPGTPLENAAAVMDAMERYAWHYSG